VAPRARPGRVLALDADPVVAAVGRAGDAVLPNLVVGEARRVDLHGEVLAGLEGWQRRPVRGHEVERGRHLALPRLALDAERLEAAPAAWPGGVGTLDGLLTPDQDASELPVGGLPGVHDFRRGRGAEHLPDGAQQVLAHNGVMLGLHLQATVLVRDALDYAAQALGGVDVLGVGEHGGGEALRLAAVALVRRVEQVVQLGVGREHVAVEGARDGLAVLAEGGHGGRDEGGASLVDRHRAGESLSSRAGHAAG